MALLFMDGFDHQNVQADLVASQGAVVWSTANFITLTAGRFGGKCATFGFNGTYLRGTMVSPVSEIYLGLAMFIQAGSRQMIYLWDSTIQNPGGGNGGSTTEQMSIGLDSANGSIQVWRGSINGGGGSTKIYQGPNNSFSSNTWFYLELHAKINSSTGLVNVRVNGQDVILISGQNTQAGSTANLDSFGFGNDTNNWVSTTVTSIDDLYLEDISVGAGPNPFNTFVGPVRLFTHFPVANSSVQFTPLASTNFSQVQETAMDSDTTYNSDNTVGHEDLFTIGALPAGLTPLAVEIVGAYRTDAAARSMTNQVKSVATDLAGVSRALNGTYTYQRDVLPTNPNGSIAWTAAAVNALTIGYKISA